MDELGVDTCGYHPWFDQAGFHHVEIMRVGRMTTWEPHGTPDACTNRDMK